jgi:peptidoglycan endopeptidase LytE
MSARILAAAVAVCLVVGLGSGALGQVDDADDPTVEEAEAALAAADATVEELRTSLAILRMERAEYERRLQQRDERQDRAIRDLREARQSAQDLAVAAYVGAGNSSAVEAAGYSSAVDALDYAFQLTLVEDSTSARYRAAHYYRDLRDQASDAVLSTMDHLDSLDTAIAATENAVAVAEDAQRAAAVELAHAHEVEDAVASLASAPGGDFQPLGSVPGGPTPAQWAALRQCESSGNYQAVSPSGLYRGAYQFDLQTWRSVGGTGDPALAPPAEQDHRAQILYSQRGASPWPVCGRYLQ